MRPKVSLRAFALVTCSLLIQSPAAPANQLKNAIDMEFVKIAPGEFMMGCSSGDDKCNADEKPSHQVQITKAFEIGKYEVTQAQWRTVMGSNPSTMQGDSRPVERWGGRTARGVKRTRDGRRRAASGCELPIPQHSRDPPRQPGVRAPSFNVR